MAIDNFIPEVWAAALLERFNTANVIIPVLNRQYEGDLRAGNEVAITAITTPSVQNYATSRSININDLDDSTLSLVIDHEDAISFKVDDVDRVQAAGAFEPVTRDAGAALAEQAELNVINALLADGTNVGLDVLTTFDDAYGVVNDIRQSLSLANVPLTGRYLIVSPQFASLLLSSSGNLSRVNQAGAAGELRNGVLGRLLGFTVIEHPQLNVNQLPAAIGFHAPSVAFVGQIDKVESGRMEASFASYIRALHVYGVAVLRPEAVQWFSAETVAPTVTGVSSSTANGSYTTGDGVSIQVTFSEDVFVTGTPTLALNTTPARSATYDSGSGTDVLTFTYTVTAGDVAADLDYASTSALALNGGSIKDGADNAAIRTLPTPGAAGSLGANKAIVIDAVVPTVTGVSSSTANDTYGADDVISIQVTFSEAVNVVTTGGTPTLALNTTPARSATYVSGTGTAVLTFEYTVVANDAAADLDYAATTSLALNGGTIKDAATNAAVLTLPTPGAAGSLGANKAIVIDAS